MTKQVVALEVNLDSKNAEKSVYVIKQEIKEANKELEDAKNNFGLYSNEVKKAESNITTLKKELNNASNISNILTSGDKFGVMAGAVKGVVGGFTALQGAMAAFGAKSNEVEQVLLKVNSAMALSQGISDIQESIKSFQKLGTVLRSIPIIQKAITAAQWLWNAAMAANPIGAIVAAVAALIAGVVALTKYLIDNSNANKTMAKEIEKSTKALNEQSKAYQKNSDELQRQQGYTLELAKAKGATTKEIRALETKLMDEKIAHLQNARQIAVNTFETEKNTLAKYKAAGATDEVITKQRELTQKALEEANKVTADLNKSLIDQVELQRKHNVQVAQEQTTADDNAKERRKKNAEEAAAQKKKDDEEALRKEEELRKDIADRIKKYDENKIVQDKTTDDLILRNRLQGIKDANYKAALEIDINRQNEIDKQVESYNQGLITKEQFEENKKLIDDYYNGLQQERIDKNNADIKEKEIKQNEDLLKARKAAADASVQITQAETEAKQKLQDAYLNSISAGIGILKMFAEKNKGLQKALLIAENGVTIARIILDTQRSIVQARASVSGISPFLPGPVPIPNPKYILAQTIANANIAQSKIAAGIGIAQALAATAKGLSSIGGGGSAGGGGSINAGGGVGGGAGGGGGVTAPVAPQLSNTILNQQAINQTGNAAIRTYVVESDVAGNQERIERLNRAARIN